LALAKAGWAALNVFSLGWSVARARAWTTGWTPVVLALAAVGKPLQSNYEHLNLTPILLALIVATAAALEARHDGRAGWWIGLAHRSRAGQRARLSRARDRHAAPPDGAARDARRHRAGDAAGGAAFSDRVAVLLHARLSRLGGDPRAPRTARALAPGAAARRRSVDLGRADLRPLPTGPGGRG